METRVAIFEDNKLMRNGFEAICDGSFGITCCGVFADCSYLDFKIQRSDPHVVLMDIEMPGIDGITATAHLVKKWPDIKILIQTVFNDSEKIFNALCAGASGYILKNDSPVKYLEAINEVYNGGSPMNPMVAKKVLGFFSGKNVIRIAPETNDYQLSQREKEILQLMTSGDNYKAIAAKAFISYETVRTHVKSIYKKLHVACRSEAVSKAVQQGIA